MESDEELPLAAAWENVKRTRITGLSALEDAQAALASLGTQLANVVVGGDGDVGSANGNDHRRHPAVLRLLSQCPFPQLAAYVSGSSTASYTSPSRRRRGKSTNAVACFPPAGGKSGRGAAAADRRLSDACGALLRGAEAAERAAREAAALLDSLEKEEKIDELLLAATEEEMKGLSLKAAAEEEEEREEEEESEDGDGDVDGSTTAKRGDPSFLSAAVSVSVAAAADALELLARMRRAVAGGPKSDGFENQEDDEEEKSNNNNGSSSPCPSSVSTPPVSPWSSPEHLHSYAVFWDLAPFAQDLSDIEVALAVERARWKRKKGKEG